MPDKPLREVHGAYDFGIEVSKLNSDIHNMMDITYYNRVQVLMNTAQWSLSTPITALNPIPGLSRRTLSNQ